MAINRPTTKTVISTTQWGIPITDQVNTNTNAIAALQSTAWTNMTLFNGWSNFGGSYALASYRKRGDMVDCRGTIQGGSSGSIFAILPTGFRSPVSLQPNARDGYLNIDSSGNMTFTGYATFSGITSFLLSFSTV